VSILHLSMFPVSPNIIFASLTSDNFLIFTTPIYSSGGREDISSVLIVRIGVRISCMVDGRVSSPEKRELSFIVSFILCIDKETNMPTKTCFLYSSISTPTLIIVSKIIGSLGIIYSALIIAVNFSSCSCLVSCIFFAVCSRCCFALFSDLLSIVVLL